jgi:GNAT superfamily N-acetyltransferase
MAIDAKNNPAGGLIGNIFGRWAHIDILWVDPKFRRKGLGRKLLLAAEREARRKGCGNLQLRVYSFQTPAFFKKMGFQPYGRLPHLPEGHTRFYLFKKMRG